MKRIIKRKYANLNALLDVIFISASVFAFLGCKSVEDPAPVELECSQRCLGYYNGDTKRWQACQDKLNEVEKQCLSKKCPDPLQTTPNGNCFLPDEGDGQTSTTPAIPPAGGVNNNEKKLVRFRVVKIDLVSDQFTQFLQKYYPQKTYMVASVRNGSQATMLSYQQFVELMAEKEGTISIPASGGNYQAEVRYFDDNWYSLANGEEHPKNAGLCGEQMQLKNAYSISSTGKVGNQTISYDFDWSSVLLSRDPSAKSYDASYKPGAGAAAQINAYIMSTPYVYQYKDPTTGKCTNESVTWEKLKEWNNSSNQILRNLAVSLINNGGLSLGFATKVRGTHTFPVALFSDIMQSVELNKGGYCYQGADQDHTWKMLFSITLSHEIGHHFLSLGHDPDETQLMGASCECTESQQEFGYVPTNETEAMCAEGQACVANESKPVLGFQETKLLLSDPIWVP